MTVLVEKSLWIAAIQLNSSKTATVKYKSSKPIVALAMQIWHPPERNMFSFISLGAMIMDDVLIEKLLYMGEGVSLDYKQQQYVVSGKDLNAKSELLKDILAFANAWRTEDAYILIGVSNSGKVIGLDHDPDDSRLQQFINSKTNHPIDFSYRSLTYQGIKLGLFTIPQQLRPVYSKNDYGVVTAHTVYVRRGSSTASADPTEIARMGVVQLNSVNALPHLPELDVKLVSEDDEDVDALNFEYVKFKLLDYPDYRSPPTRPSAYSTPLLYFDNEDYYRELASYIKKRLSLFKLQLCVTNSGSSYADDVRIYVELAGWKNGNVLLDAEAANRPKKSHLPGNTRYEKNLIINPLVDILSKKDKTIILFHVGKIHSGESLRTTAVFLESPPAEIECVLVKILSDQLHAPKEVTIPARISYREVDLTLEMLKRE
ncbi:AlbA family DNA-binding domain-containing protein [Pseudomonas brassicacearum]|uniref:AlbA family DNA-binding domain-containing protein n=1 Tax=Pseudomonas brassicacearum TaxID=930166 RepID=UPI00025FDC71|nr:putative divergent AAA domain protein [Pseudomonas fluorescens Q8r1-96]